MRFRPFAFLLLSLTMFPVLAVSQTDEIQVYDGELAPPGILNRKRVAPQIGRFVICCQVHLFESGSISTHQG